MTVDELIVKLAAFPGDMPVYVDSDYCDDTDHAMDVTPFVPYWRDGVPGVRIYA